MPDQLCSDLTQDDPGGRQPGQLPGADEAADPPARMLERLHQRLWTRKAGEWLLNRQANLLEFDPQAPLEMKTPLQPPVHPPQAGPPVDLAPRGQPQPRPDYRRSLPVPLRLPLLHALLSFSILSLLPSHRISIPTALGLAFAVVFYIQLLANRQGYHTK